MQRLNKNNYKNYHEMVKIEKKENCHKASLASLHIFIVFKAKERSIIIIPIAFCM